MATAARFPSLASSVQDSSARRTDSRACEFRRSISHRRAAVSSVVTRPFSLSARSSANTGCEGFAKIDSPGVDSLLKVRKGKASAFEATLTFFREPFARTPDPNVAELLCQGNGSQSTDLMRKRGSEKSCGWTSLHSRCSSDHFGKWLRASCMMRIVSCGFPVQSVLANIAWTFVIPPEVLAESCENNSISLPNMPLLFIIALIGATVGGLLARQRKRELARLNDQLRQINAALRRQAKIESYAPNLSYAPVGKIAENDIIVDPKKQEVISTLKSGKNYLRLQNPEKAFDEFKAALELAQRLGDPVEEKKAARGLGAALQRQGKFREAIKYHTLVLSISRQTGEESGNTEAYGAIADCYTELGDLERAGRFYDQYISRLEKD